VSYDTGTDRLLVSVSDRVAVMTFNNPAKHNVLSADVRAALPGALRALQADDEVRVVVLTGAGERAFVAGADISEFAEQRTTADARASFDRAGADIGRAWDELEKPVVAMIRGYCIGGGLLTALQADIRVAADDSQFGIPAARLGLGYEFGGVEALVSVVGSAWAAEILFSARRLDAEEALRIGLVNRVVPGSDLGATTMELARVITANAPLTLAACKVAIRQARRPHGRRDLDRVRAMAAACFDSADYVEGQRAFAEKRPPRFTGR
jgi:enoyl-CoA hydratase